MNSSNFVPREKADFVITFSHNGEDIEITGQGAVTLEQEYAMSPWSKNEAQIILDDIDGFNIKATNKKLPVEHTARVTVDKVTPENVEKARVSAGVPSNTEFVVTLDNRTLRDNVIEFRWTA